MYNMSLLLKKSLVNYKKNLKNIKIFLDEDNKK